MKLLKNIIRVVLAAPLCILSIKLVELNDLFQIILFVAIYVLVSLIIEPIFQKIENRHRIKSKK